MRHKILVIKVRFLVKIQIRICWNLFRAWKFCTISFFSSNTVRGFCSYPIVSQIQNIYTHLTFLRSDNFFQAKYFLVIYWSLTEIIDQWPNLFSHFNHFDRMLHFRDFF